ncbi:hypothetical protein [Nocardia callitridis]|uniref:Uncharacterized protein n=1 Tax=Nocardia callitridis TaxID=648753 RepID=A0ABP9KEX1_9NOCA
MSEPGADAVSPLPWRLARTSAEAHLYMDLHPCGTCATARFHPRGATVFIDGELGSRFAGACQSCGALREFVFRLPEHIVLSGDRIRYGADRPSELIDPGEWLLVADGASARGRVDPTGLTPQGLAAHRDLLDTAVAAMEEVLKFVPPRGDAVPDSVFFSARGRAVYEAEPGRFGVVRLIAVLDTYREIAARFGRD